jgi:hypothetical protein
MIALFTLAVIFLSCAGYVVYAACHRRSVSSQSWSHALEKLQTVDVDGLRVIANSYLQPNRNQPRGNPAEMWMMVGGVAGIRRLKANAKIMLNLAILAEQSNVVAERWNREGEYPVSEMIRRDAIQLNKAIMRIQWIYVFRLAFLQTPAQLQDTAQLYFLIRNRLLSFYETSHVELLPRLQVALNPTGSMA